MKYHTTKIRIAFFKFFRKIGEAGDNLAYSIRKILYKPIKSEKAEIAIRKVSKFGKKIIFNMGENKRNWGHRINSGDNFKINHEDV